jgi:hypothetical protein
MRKNILLGCFLLLSSISFIPQSYAGENSAAYLLINEGYLENEPKTISTSIEPLTFDTTKKLSFLAMTN